MFVSFGAEADLDASEFEDRPIARTGEAIVKLESLSHIDRAGAPHLFFVGDKQQVPADVILGGFNWVMAEILGELVQ